MKDMGFDTVWLQECMVPHWVRNDIEDANIINGKEITHVNICALGGSIATDKKGLTADIIEVDGLDALKKMNAADVKGKIVIAKYGGSWRGIKPKVAVIMIGTNNTGSDSAESIASGVAKIVSSVRTKLPSTQILLLAVFPRGNKPDGKLGAGYEKIKEINSVLAKLDDRKTIHFLDIGDKFIQGKDAQIGRAHV